MYGVVRTVRGAPGGKLPCVSGMHSTQEALGCTCQHSFAPSTRNIGTAPAKKRRPARRRAAAVVGCAEDDAVPTGSFVEELLAGCSHIVESRRSSRRTAVVEVVGGCYKGCRVGLRALLGH